MITNPREIPAAPTTAEHSADRLAIRLSEVGFNPKLKRRVVLA